LDRINTPVQTSVLEPPRFFLKDAERFRENEIWLGYESDLAKQLAADNYREAESAKARLNDLLIKNPASQTVPASPTDFVDDSHIAKLHDPFRKFTREDLSADTPSQIAYQPYVDDDVHQRYQTGMASLRSEIEDLRRSQGSPHQATSSTNTNTTLTPTVPSVTTVLAYPSKSETPNILLDGQAAKLSFSTPSV
jgi:hypothetical protein